jgi:hypothetical protein
MEREEVEAGDGAQAERERRWMQLYHKRRAEMWQHMQRLEDEMAVGERLDLVDKVR